MKVQYTRPASSGGGLGTRGSETMVAELPDLDGDGHATPVPDGAVKVDDGVAAHDWQHVRSMAGFPGGGID